MAVFHSFRRKPINNVNDQYRFFDISTFRSNAPSSYDEIYLESWKEGFDGYCSQHMCWRVNVSSCLKDLTYDYVRMNESLNPRDVCLSITQANSEYTTSSWLCDKIKCPLPRVGSHTFLNVLKYVLLVWITGNSFITCSIPSAHDFRVIRRAHGRALVQNVRDLSQTKLDKGINSPLLSNEHGGPRFFSGIC